MRQMLLLMLLGLAGCAGSILSHKPYHLTPGTVVLVTQKKVVTLWADGHARYGGFDGELVYVGDEVYSVCPETVPPLGLKFKRVDLNWDKMRKCWKWQKSS